MLLSEALNEFIAWGSIKYAPSTVSTYRSLIRRYILYGGDKDVGCSSFVDISEYYEHLRRKNYHDSSIAYMMISLRQFFRFLFIRQLTKWDYQLIPVPKYVNRGIPPIEPSDARKMIDRLRTTNLRDLRNKTIFSFLYSTGVRVSELCDVQMVDMNFSERTAMIISRKTKTKRMILWSEETACLLAQYIPERERAARCDNVFISLDRKNYGGMLTTRAIQRFIVECRPSKHITAHSYRKGFGCRAVKANVHVRYIQKLLGHESIASTQIYMDTYDPDVVKAYKKIPS